jgi:CubicO group peptidase (beta-lactamase class C family)
MRKFLALAILLGCALAGGVPARSQNAPSPGALSTEQAAAIDAIGRRSIDQGGAPSVEIAVLRDGAFVYRKGFGVRNVEDAVPPDATTRYPIGSNTKQFTAAAILMLQDQDKLNVDDRLAKYLPEIPHAREVTLRNLLMHTGGYAEYTEIETFDEIGARPATPAQIVATVVKRPLGFKPGTKRQYSNTGYILLQMVIERLSGVTYADFLRRRIFKPLGMSSTFVRDSDDTRSDVATEYTNFALGPWEHALHIDYTWFGGAGSIVSNAADLAKWNAALDGGELLSPHSLAEMMTPVKIDANFPDYGFAIENSKLPNGHRMIAHGGNTTGAATQDARFPDDHLAIIVMANSGFYDYTQAVNAVYQVLVPPGPAAKPSPHPTAPKRTPLPAGANPATVDAAKAWLDAAVAGHVDLAKLRPDFRARMSREHLAALRALASFGKRTYTLAHVERRAPTTSYLFLVTAGSHQLVYLYEWDDDGSIAGTLVISRLTFGPAAPSPSPSVPATTAP